MAELGSAVGKRASAEGMGTSHREVDWKYVFFIAAGVPALVLFSMGGISATIGAPAWLVWTISVLIGFISSFAYVEVAGLHPSKTGGTAVHGATAWVRYSKIFAPVSLWCNWLAWTPVLAIGSGLGAGYLLSIFFAPTAPVNTWQITLVDLGFLQSGLSLRINATFIIGVVIMLAVFAIQHGGVLRIAKLQRILTVGTLLPLFIVTIVPLFQGNVLVSNFTPFDPIAFDNAGKLMTGSWNLDGWRLFFGGLFIAAWSAYAFETAVCYMSEFKDPARDNWRAMVYSGLLCIIAYTVVPVIFQGVLGTEGMLSPGIASGGGLGRAMADMVSAGPVVRNFLVVLLFFSLILSIMTAMAGSSRTLHQGGQDGWLPKYLGQANEHGAPTNAMWTDLAFNLILLMMSNYLFVLAVSNCNYLISNFFNLNSGWLHRIDNPEVKRPYRCPTWLLTVGIAFAYFNWFLLGAGANVWGKGTLWAGFISAAIVLPFYLYRHYVTDRGKSPDHMWQDLLLPGQTELGRKRAGILPYIALVAGLGCVFLGYAIFWL